MFMIKLAWRYVHARIINFVAVLVVGMTLMASIVVLGVIDGMLVDMERRIRDLGEQVAVYLDRPVPEESLADISLPDGVKGFTPLVNGYALLKHGMITEPGVAYGIDLKKEAELSSIARHLQEFRLNPMNPQWFAQGVNSAGLPGAFVGVMLAERLSLKPGDVFTVNYAPSGSNRLISVDFMVSSIFKSGSPLKDRNGFFIPITEARKMFMSPLAAKNRGVRALSFFLDDPDAANKLEKPVVNGVLRGLDDKIGGLRSTTWQKRWRSMHEGMAYENMLMEVVLFFMNLSAGFCVFAVLATLVSRRVRDVGLLRCLGAGRRHTVGIFLLVGLIIGVLGVILGVGGGYVVGYNINEIWRFFTGMDLYPPRMFGHASQPVIYTWKVALYAGGAIFISVLSALYPAIWAGCREPVESLRDS